SSDVEAGTLASLIARFGATRDTLPSPWMPHEGVRDRCHEPAREFLAVLKHHGIDRTSKPPKIFFYTEEYEHMAQVGGVDVGACMDTEWYDVERMLAEQLKTCFGTDRPSQADWFLIQHRGTCIAHRRAVLSNATTVSPHFAWVGKNYMLPLLQHIRSRHPYFDASNGRNHIVISSHDLGLYSFGDEVMKAYGETVRLQLLGIDRPPWLPGLSTTSDRPYRDIVVPTRHIDTAVPQIKCLNTDRACFFGTVFPNKVYSNGVRQALQAAADTDARLFVRGFINNYAQQLCGCRFSLCPSGWLPWSPRLVDSIILHTLPVIIADNIRLPFARWLDYTKFTIKLHEATVRDNATRALDMLFSMPPIVHAAKLEALYAVAPLVSYEYDALYMVALELWWAQQRDKEGMWKRLPSHYTGVGQSQYIW
ncbi:exostosin family protein, partial [archaeon]